MGSMRAAFGIAAMVWMGTEAAHATPTNTATVAGIPIAIEITSHQNGQGHSGSTATLVAEGRIGGDAVEDDGSSAVALVLDVSCSAYFVSDGDCGGDQDGDGVSDTVLDCELLAAAQLVAEAASSGAVDEVGYAFFQRRSAQADVSPDPGFQWFTSPDADDDLDTIPDIIESMYSIERTEVGYYQTAGPTLYTVTNAGMWPGGSAAHGGVSRACDMLAMSDAVDRRIILLTDGMSNQFPKVWDAAPCIPNAPVTILSLGNEATCERGHKSWGSMDQLAALTGGHCYLLPDASDLPDVLPQFVRPEVISAHLTINGGTPIDLATYATPALPNEGFDTITFSYGLTGLTSGTDVCIEMEVQVFDAIETVEHCVELHENTAPVASISGPVLVDEGGFVQLDASASADVDLDTLSYTWQVDRESGMDVPVGNTGEDALAFPTLDEGIYTVQVVVSDGVDSDVIVTEVVVQNADPTTVLQIHDGLGGGITTLAGQIRDSGPFDTHFVTVDWGDGNVESLYPSASGPGWGTFVVSHAYEGTGSYEVGVTVDDGDGGVWIGGDTTYSIAPMAVWAGNTTLHKAFDWGGCGGTIRGAIHSNSDLWIGGGGKLLTGAVTAAGDLHVRGDATFEVAPTSGSTISAPVPYDVEDYGPEGSRAAPYAANYYDHTSECVSGTWTATGVLPEGIHVADCDMVLDLANAKATFVATGTIRVVQDGAQIEAYTDGVALMSASESDFAVSVEADDAGIYGFLVAKDGGVSVGGASLSLACGVVGDRVDLAGGGLLLDAGACTTAGPAQFAPLMVPNLNVTVAATPTDLSPGTEVTATTTIAFDAIHLLVPAVLGVENLGEDAVTALDVDVTVSTRTSPSGSWSSLVLPVDTRATPLDTSGGLSGDLEAGPVELDPGESGYWTLETVLTASGTALDDLLTAAVGGEIRFEISVDVDNPEDGPVRIVSHTATLDLSEATSGLEGVEVVLIGVDGVARTLDVDDDADLALLEPGVTVELEVEASPSPLAPIGGQESVEDYLTRLRLRDETAVGTVAYATAQFNEQPVLARLVSDTGTLHVPYLLVEAQGEEWVEEELVVGVELPLDIFVRNVSSGAALELDVEQTFAASAVTFPALPTFLDPTEWGHTTSTVTVGDALAGSTPAIVTTVAWEDDEANTYGPIEIVHTLTVEDLPSLRATLVDTLVIDADTNGGVTPGDTVEYVLTVRAGLASVADVELEIPIDAEGTYVTSSASSSQGSVTVNTSGASPVLEVDVGNMSAEAVVTITFRVEVPGASTTSFLSHQALVAATSITAFGSDDPTFPGHNDPTTTPVLSDDPVPLAMLGMFVSDDVDGNGYPSPGDQVRVLGLVGNDGAGTMADVELRVPVPYLTTIVPGTFEVSTGSLLDGDGPGDDEVVFDLGNFSAGTMHQVSFDIRLLPGTNLIGMIETQGDLTSSDGPGTDTWPLGEGGEPEPTVLMVGDPPYPDHGENYEGPFPTAEILSPADGDRISQPTPVLASLDATEGEMIQGYRVLLRRGGSVADDDRIELAFEIGAPTDAEIAVIDPTVLENGLYVLEVVLLDTAGLVGWTEVQIFVDTDFKPGRYVLAETDARVSTPVGELALTRVYDTLAKDIDGDFGHGWRLATSTIRVQTNGPLGYRGWQKVECGDQMYWASQCFVTAKPHVVAITWPDGRQDVWDFVPKASSSLLGFIVQPAFVARAGTRGTLTVDPQGHFRDGYFDSTNGNIKGGMGGQYGLFDPDRYVLTQPDGTKLWLSPELGLERMEDRFGNWTTYDENGVHALTGGSIVFDRDANGRIVTAALEDGTVYTYAYTEEGNLTEVTDPALEEIAYWYDTEHRLTQYGFWGETAMAVMTYDSEGRLISEEGSGFEVTQTFDAEAFTITEVGPDPDLTTVTTFDEDGVVESVEQQFDSESYLTLFTYDTQFRPIEIVHPTGAIEEFTYDAEGRLASHTDAAGITTTTTFGLYDQPLVTTVGGVVTERIDQDPVTGQVTARKRGDHSVIAAYTYDTRGRPIEVENGTEEVTSIVYGPNGYPSVVTLPGGTAQVVLAYDEMGRKTSVMRPDGGVRSYAYDARGNLLTLTDPDGESQTFEYDELNRVVTYTPKGGGESTTYVYDDQGRVASITNRNDETVTYAYDDAGRLASKWGGSGPYTLYTYDPLGRMLTASVSSVHSLVWTYDEAGVLTQTSSGTSLYPTKTFTWTRDEAGRPETMDGPGGEVTYGYDAAGRLVSVDHADLGEFVLGWDNSFRPTTLARPNGALTTMTYDGADRIEDLVTEVSSTEVHSLGYTYSTSGYPSTMTTSAGTHSYTHDLLGRLTAADHPGGSGLTDEAYTYDASFSRTSWTNASGEHESTDVVYDDADRLVQDLLFTYTYDDEGQRLTRTGRVSSTVTTYAWNKLGELVEVEEPSGEVWAFEYDALGRRTKVRHDVPSEDPEILTFVYDDVGLVHGVYDGVGDVVVEYVTGVNFGEVLAELRPDGSSGTDVRYAVRDKLGSAVAWLDEAGAVAEEVLRDSYGVRASGPAAPEAYGFTGHAEDPTGLAWGRARYLDPGTGGWLSDDPDEFQPRAQYVFGAPLALWDPTGMAAISEKSITACKEVINGIQTGGRVAIQISRRAGAYYKVAKALGKSEQAAGTYVHGKMGANTGGRGRVPGPNGPVQPDWSPNAGNGNRTIELKKCTTREIRRAIRQLKDYVNAVGGMPQILVYPI